MKNLIYLIILLLFNVYLCYSNLETEEHLINETTNTFIERIATNQLTRAWQKKYISENYLYLGGEINTTYFHIIGNYNIKECKQIGDSAIVTIEIDRYAIISETDLIEVNDKIELAFHLLKQDNIWKINGQFNRRRFRLLDTEYLSYMSELFNTLYPKDVYKGTYNFPIYSKMYNSLLYYYHNKFIYPDDYLEELTPEYLKLLRNEYFAHYGRSFDDSFLDNYFQNKVWYKINFNYSDELLTKNDIYNITNILKFEELGMRH